MKKAFFVVLLALLYAMPSTAQTDSLRREIGFSTQIIFDNIFESGGAPFELMLKKRRGENSWMRYGLQAYYGSNEYVDFNHNHSHSSVSFSPSAGIEKRKALSSSWQFLYGGEASISYSYYETEQRNTNNSDFSEWLRKTEKTTYGGALRPFIGISYFITPRLYVTTEASLLLSVSRVQNWGSEEDYNNTVRQYSQDTWNKAAVMRPASHIFVYYRF
ncbi:hypothetical protein [Cesiribacter sp. SM1]|uniref:hypothetical protein n=1 Tax=Cesiribacter sp. SM1 TaxID=2861196 RepID=UPI001CD1CDB1|nr:hypothetical protein [Cesiribacter sp. SM1]